MQPARRTVVAVLVMGMALATAAAQEAVLLSENAGGILELEGERELEISGLHGSILARPGEAGELRFAAREMDDRTAERPVALWLEGNTLRLTPLEGAAEAPVRLEVALPPSLETHVDASDSKVQLNGLKGATEVRGERLELTGRMFDGSVDLEVQESTVHIIGVSEELSIEGEQLFARLENVAYLSLSLDGGELHVNRVLGDVDADVENAHLTIDGVSGQLRLHASGGTLAIAGCAGGAELELVEMPLDLRLTKGTFDIETDSEVVFESHEGPMDIRSRGAAVRGSQASGGTLSIETNGAEVRVEDFEASTTIRGDNLDVHASLCKGELTVDTAYSTIVVEQAEKAVSIENEFGDVEVREASQLVQVVSRDGDVRIEALKGPAQVSGEGPEVAVHWSGLTGNETSVIENARGDVRVSLPTSTRCRFDLAAPRGQVVSDIGEVEVSDDGHFATGGLLGGGRSTPYVKRPTIRVTSAGDLYFNGASQATPAP
jgi:hypothetical protein